MDKSPTSSTDSLHSTTPAPAPITTTKTIMSPQLLLDDLNSSAKKAEPLPWSFTTEAVAAPEVSLTVEKIVQMDSKATSRLPLHRAPPQQQGRTSQQQAHPQHALRMGESATDRITLSASTDTAPDTAASAHHRTKQQVIVSLSSTVPVSAHLDTTTTAPTHKKAMSIAKRTPPSHSAALARSTLAGMSSSSSSGKRKGRKPSASSSSGRWTDAEHAAFLHGLATYGREWKKVAHHIPTRTSAQVRSHAQKYFSKLQRDHCQATAAQWYQQQDGSAGGTGCSSSNSNSATLATSSDPEHVLSGAAAMQDQQHGVGHRPQQFASASLQANVARILARPDSVRQEVEDTLRQLRERYRLLHGQLQMRSSSSASSSTAKEKVAGVPADEDTSTSDLSNDEWIALSVLQGALPAGDSPSQASLSFDEDDDEEEKEAVSPKRPRHE